MARLPPQRRGLGIFFLVLLCSSHCIEVQKKIDHAKMVDGMLDRYHGMRGSVSEPIKYNIYLKNRLSLFDITFTMNSCNTFDAAK